MCIACNNGLTGGRAGMRARACRWGEGFASRFVSHSVVRVISPAWNPGIDLPLKTANCCGVSVILVVHVDRSLVMTPPISPNPQRLTSATACPFAVPSETSVNASGGPDGGLLMLNAYHQSKREGNLQHISMTTAVSSLRW